QLPPRIKQAYVRFFLFLFLWSDHSLLKTQTENTEMIELGLPRQSIGTWTGLGFPAYLMSNCNNQHYNFFKNKEGKVFTINSNSFREYKALD
ncbi:hypothetical protein BY996DRAFT_6798455, partial [Phakopsora pachyrhizi]